MRHSLRIQDLHECCKQALWEAAREDLLKRGRSPSISRLSVMTGMHRRDVMRLEREEVSTDFSKDLITRIVGQWQTDQRFLTKSGKPRILRERDQFPELVRSVTQDLGPATVLFELERVNAIERGSAGVSLKVESYVPRDDVFAGFRILSRDIEDLTTAVEANLEGASSVPHLHARTEYDNVRPEYLDEVRSWLVREGHLFHRKVRDYLSQFDQDVNPDPQFKGRGARVILTAFSKTEEGNDLDK